MAKDGFRLEHDLWIVVADGEKALFLRNKGDALHPHLEVVGEMQEKDPAAEEQVTDKPGRMQDGPSPHRSAVEETDWNRLSKERFAEEITGRLRQHSLDGEFKKLVIVAPPVVLAEMRRKLHKEVADKVTGEIAKTLTNHPVDKIEKLLMAA